MITVLAGIAMAALGLWILSPLRSPLRQEGGAADARWRELVDAKQAIYRSILDLEFDQSVGKVSGADYTYLRRQQEAEAMGILKQMDALASTQEATSDTLEAEIAEARQRLLPPRPPSS
jgi:hypothetical protein